MGSNLPKDLLVVSLATNGVWIKNRPRMYPRSPYLTLSKNSRCVRAGNGPFIIGSTLEPRGSGFQGCRLDTSRVLSMECIVSRMIGFC